MVNTKLVKLNTTYKLIIPDNVNDKIKYACCKLPNVEWSGVLFYTYSGSFNTQNLVITCEDFYVMDIGTVGATAFNMTPEVISYMTDNNLLNTQIGLIHSHNNMPTFFSGTDTNTLLIEGSERNHFVSLIVNNAGKYTAAITKKVSTHQKISESLKYQSYNNEIVDESSEYELKDTIVYYHLLDITKKDVDFSDLDNRLSELKKTSNTSFISTSSITPKTTQMKLFDDPIEEKPNKKEKIEGIVKQIITGYIFADTSNKLDIDKFASTLDKFYDSKFKHYDLKFITWAENHVCSVLEMYPDLTRVELEKVITRLQSLPTSSYVDHFISNCYDYLELLAYEY